MSIFDPGQGPLYQRLMQKARRANARRTAMERAGPLAAPEDCPFDETLRTVISALAIGIDDSNWDCVAEGLAMLQAAEAEFRDLVGLVEQAGRKGR